MKHNTPREIVLYASLITAVAVSLGVGGLLFLFFDVFSWFILLASSVTTFGCTYFLFHYMLERFIYKKIKLIYKTIHDQKTQKTVDVKPVEMNRDVLKDVDLEVMNWAKDKREEIRQLKDQEAFRREFIGNLAHELKTPIFNIQGYVDTLLEGGLEDKNINSDYLSRADKNIDRLIDLVKDLDTINKLESKKEMLDLKKTDIVALTEDVFQSLEMKAKKQGVTLKFKEQYDKPIWVKADKGKIHQVLTNLVANSINYGKKEGETEVRYYDLDENILIEIADNGIGIPKDHLPRLFERFYRVDKSRSRQDGGSGLGLAIVKHIIDAHNQTINVRSTEAIGSTFSFTLEKVG